MLLVAEILGQLLGRQGCAEIYPSCCSMFSAVGNSSVFSPMLEYRFSAAGKCTVFLPHDAMGEGPNYLVQESEFVV